MPSLSQKYRPKTFAEITGQSHVTETLRKEVATGILAHAFLFSGPRGVGKTTAARVFAKALNCLDSRDGEPCNACASCEAANAGRFFDLIELDAATHTGIETVREAIVEHARFAPMIGTRKIYVLDEAHMLSTSSWNALLKTLEEPPAHAFFILATTEWHKVPSTIVSRCQRFEFKRIPREPLSDRIRQLAKAEGWKIDTDVVDLIISRAEGCVRDAETLLGQLGALGESHLTGELASLVIPPSHLPLAVALMTLWADGRQAEGLAEAQRLFQEGVPIQPLFDDLLAIVRALLVGSTEEASVEPLVGRFSPGLLNDMALLFMERRRDVKSGLDPLFALELAGTAVACGLLKHSDKRQETNNKGQETATPPTPSLLKRGCSDASRGGGVDQGQEAIAIPPSILQLETVRLKWNTVVRAVEEKNHSLPFILKISRPEEVRGATIIIRFQYPFHLDKIMNDIKSKRLVEEAAQTVFGDPAIRVDGVVGEDEGVKEHRSNDMVSNVLKAFGGSVIEEGSS